MGTSRVSAPDAQALSGEGAHGMGTARQRATATLVREGQWCKNTFLIVKYWLAAMQKIFLIREMQFLYSKFIS